MPPHGCLVAALLTIACNLHSGIAVDQFRNRRPPRQDSGDRIEAIPGICNLRQIGARQGGPRQAIPVPSTGLCSWPNLALSLARSRSERADRATQFAETAAMDDGRFAGPSVGAVCICIRRLLGLDPRNRRPRNRTRAGCRARTCAESVRDHRPQPVGDRRDRPRRSRCRDRCARTIAASAAEATGRCTAAGEIGLDFRRQGPRPRQQPGRAGAGDRFFRPRLFQGPHGQRYRNLYRRSADAAAALSGRRVFRRQQAAPQR